MLLKPLTPPLRFSTVAFACTDEPQPWHTDASIDSTDPRSHPHHRESVYRGAYPKTRNLYFLSCLHLRTVLSLTPRPLDNDETLLAWSTSSTGSATSSPVRLADKVSNAGIQLLHVRCEKPKDESGGLTREGAARALSILLDRRNHPIYVHCLDGVEVTSTLVACMRKVQAWSNPAIFAELGRALRDSNSSEWVEVPSHLSSFLNKFGQPDGIRLPPRNHIPSWLWPSPNPLSVLADPYAWAGAPSVNGQEQNGASLGGSSAAPSHPIHHSRRDRQLPIHHPTLKLHFDIDLDLPPEPVPAPPPTLAASTAASSTQRPSTPSRSLQHSRTSSYNSIANIRSPPHSRPASRAGRPSHLLSSRSASQASEDDRAGPSSTRRSESTARDFSSLLGQGGDVAASAVPSIAAFLEDQLQDHASTPFSHHGVHESPTRRSRLNIETLPSSLPDRTSPTKAHAPQALSDADEEIDVSTPRARPTTSSTIGITGTIFHHDDEITDSEDASPARGRIGVPLEQRRRLLDEADGEATPTRTSAVLPTRRRALPEDPDERGMERRQTSTVSVDSSESPQKANRGEDMVQSPTVYADDEDYVSHRQKAGSQDDSGQDADASHTDGTQSEDEAEEADEDEEEEEEEEEEDEDEDEDEEEEEDDEDEDEDDLALEALDLEGY